MLFPSDPISRKEVAKNIQFAYKKKSVRLHSVRLPAHSLEADLQTRKLQRPETLEVSCILKPERILVL